MLRGNHESREMTEMFNFREQCIDLYDEEFYDEVMNTFDMIPIAAVVNGLYLCMHGGISENVPSITAINQVDRKMEPPDEGLMSDIMWADPATNRDFNTDYVFNDKREVSVIYGKKPVNKLLEASGLRGLIRAHECKKKGYK
jgi:serine/threonine-protein phosphatase 2B catalytic subunit